MWQRVPERLENSCVSGFPGSPPCLSTEFHEPGNNLIWREPCQQGAASGLLCGSKIKEKQGCC